MRMTGLSGGFSYARLLAGSLFCVAVYYAFLGNVNPDEIEAIHTAWKILRDGAIYRDFFQHHHPLFYYSLIPVIKAGGESVLSLYLAEFFTFVIFSAIAATTFFLAEKIYGDRTTSWFSVVLLFAFPYFITRGTEARPDVLQVLLGLLSFYFLVVYLDGKAKKHLVLSAFLLSLSFMVLQKAVFLVFVTGLVLLYYLFRNGNGKVTKEDFFLYWAIFLLPPASYVVYLYVTGGLQNYFDFNWLINMKFLRSFSPFKSFPLALHKTLFMTLSMMILTLLFIRGCFSRAGETGEPHRFVALAGVCLVASVFSVPAPFPQYFLMASPFVALVAAFSLRRFFTDSTAKKCLTVLVLFCCAYVISGTKGGGKKEKGVSIIRHVLSVSESEDLFYGYRKGNLFRHDADFFWFCHEPRKCVETYQSFRDYDYNPMRIIMETRPKVVYTGGHWSYASVTKHPYFVSNYQRSSKYPSIYVRKDSPLNQTGFPE